MFDFENMYVCLCRFCYEIDSIDSYIHLVILLRRLLLLGNTGSIFVFQPQPRQERCSRLHFLIKPEYDNAQIAELGFLLERKVITVNEITLNLSPNTAGNFFHSVRSEI